MGAVVDRLGVQVAGANLGRPRLPAQRLPLATALKRAGVAAPLNRAAQARTPASEPSSEASSNIETSIAPRYVCVSTDPRHSSSHCCRCRSRGFAPGRIRHCRVRGPARRRPRGACPRGRRSVLADGRCRAASAQPAHGEEACLPGHDELEHADMVEADKLHSSHHLAGHSSALAAGKLIQCTTLL